MSQQTWLRRQFQQSWLRPLITKFHHRGLREEDVFLAAYPKSGMTWLRNLIAAYFLEDVDGWMDDIRRVSFRVGRHQQLDSFLPSGGRMINTHEPYRSDYRRAVLLVRDGRDVAVSEYNFWREHYQDRQFQEVDFTAFLQQFLAGKTHGYSAWHEHTRSWFDSPLADTKRLHVLRFESLKSDTETQLDRLLRFLGVAPEAGRVAAAVERSSIESMRKAERKNPNQVTHGSFIRKGSAGSWQDTFSASDESLFMASAEHAMLRLGYGAEEQRPTTGSVASGSKV